MEQTSGQRMYTAISAGDAEQVRRILVDHPEELSSYPGVAASWLHYAAGKGWLSVVDAFLAAGLPVDHRTMPDGDTPLIYAVRHSQFETVKYLLSLKADPSASRMLVEAINAKVGNFDLVKLLVEHGSDVNLSWRFGEEEDGPVFNPLSWAVDGEHTEIADYLRSQGAVLPPQVQ